MLINVISTGRNTGELAALQAAKDRHITTGGWVPRGFRPKYWDASGNAVAQFSEEDMERFGLRERGKADPSETNLAADPSKAKSASGLSKADLVNVRAADMTLLVEQEGFLTRRASRRRATIMGLKRKGHPVVNTFAISTEVPEIAHNIRLWGREIINIVCIQNEPHDDLLVARSAYFFAELYDALYNVIQTRAGSEWELQERQTRRKIRLPTPVSTFLTTLDRRFLHAAKAHARETIFSAIEDFPVEYTKKRRIIEDAYSRQGREFEQMQLPVGNPKQYYPYCCFRNALLALTKVKPRLLSERDKRRLSRGGMARVRWDRTVEREHRGRTPRDIPIQIPALDQTCRIVANTRLREERVLRTFLLLVLGGAKSDKSAWSMLVRLRKEMERSSAAFRLSNLSRRFNKLATPGRWRTFRWFNELDAPTHSVDWFYIGEKTGQLWDRFGKQDKFKALREKDNVGALEAELFYFVDEFRTNSDLWTEQCLATFAKNLCWLCGTDESAWRGWFGLA